MGKIPKEAKRVFEWVMFDVRQWQQLMFDGSLRTFEMISREHTGIVLPIQDDKIALTYQIQPHKHEWYWDFFGWRIDDGEDPLLGTERELLEEAWMVSDDRSLVFTSSKSWHIDWNSYYFVARDVRVIQETTYDGGEKMEIRWVSFEEMVELIKTDKLLDIHLKAELMTLKIDGNLDEFREKIMWR